VNDAAGRLPNVLAGWLTLAAVYLAAARFFGAGAAQLSCCCYLASYMFLRHARLAETDQLVTLFVTAAIYFCWRFIETDDLSAPYKLAHASAACAGAAVLAKGLPAAFVLIFFVLVALLYRRASRLWKFCLTGAPVTFALIALPWFLYARTLPEWHIVTSEVSVALGGEKHRGHFYQYFPLVLLDVAPWCGFMVGGFVAATSILKQDRKLQALFCWIGAIFIPLCLAGQKQGHYLVPLMPALAILSGWFIDASANQDAPRRWRDISRGVLLVTIGVVILAPVGIILGAWSRHHALNAGDFLMSALAVIGGIAVWAVFSRTDLRRGSMALAVVIVILLLAGQAWYETLEPPSQREIAAQIRRRLAPENDRRLCFYGENESLPLSWELRSVVPTAATARQLREMSDASASLVAIVQEKNGVRPPPPPVGFVEAGPSIVTGEQAFHLYVRSGD
jgi:4-amino-4-deoxy-L-arabinose transferase-like glycosyltransferase